MISQIGKIQNMFAVIASIFVAVAQIILWNVLSAMAKLGPGALLVKILKREVTSDS